MPQAQNLRLITEAAYFAGLYRFRDRGEWATSTVYAIGDRVTFSNWVYLVTAAHTSTTFSPTANVIAVGQMPDAQSFAQLRAGSVPCSPPWQIGTSSAASVAANVNSVTRIPVGRTCTVTSVSFEVTTAGTGPVSLAQYTSDNAGGLTLVKSLATGVAAATVGMKTATVSVPVIAGQDLYIGFMPTGSVTVRKHAAFDPALQSNTLATQSAASGFTGFASTSQSAAIANSGLTNIALPRLIIAAAS